jgi:hypothetical protein
LLYFGAALVSHMAFNFWDASGFFCESHANAKGLAPDEKVELVFPSSAFCLATGIAFERGARYSINIIRSEDWADGDFTSPVDGHEMSELPTWTDRFKSFAMLPLRRVFLREWFRPIARIGQYGNDEYFLDPPPDDTAQTITKELLSAFTARRSGELFLYVNDATIGLPWWTDYFYKDNRGTATVTVQRLKSR